MRAVFAEHRGGPEQLTVGEQPTPSPGPGEVLIAVYAAAITLAELTWDLSWQTSDGRDRTPVIPSHEVSGTVAALGLSAAGLSAAGLSAASGSAAGGSAAGGSAAGFEVGDEVYGLIDFDRNGAAAEYVTAPAATLARKPAKLSHVQAAALPLAALTAWQALVDHAQVKAGERVLVQGGAGGVGVYGVQLAAGLGAHVIATDRPANESFVRGLGAAEFIADRFDERVSDVDVVLDTVGGPVLDRSFGVLRRGGRLVTLTAPPSQSTAAEHGVDATFFVVSPDQAELTGLARRADEGSLRAVVSSTFPLESAREAYSVSGPRPPGKIVLLVR